MTTPATPDRPRLIETAFPLKQASLDSVHEKNVRHGHISTLHIWPARRPLAASRAALIATLLPDPGTADARRKLVERIGGRVVMGKDGKETTEGGILHWGRESHPDMDWFRAEIRKAYGGRAPRVLDPFAGGGAIPLEAMRLGCEVTAVDINPVAWFILKCTLEYPQRLAGQTRPLPAFVRQDRAFLEAFFKARGLKGKALAAQIDRVLSASTLPSPPQWRGAGGEVASPQLAGMESSDALPEADLAWHVRAWGAWVLARARRDLAPYYPTVDGKPTVAYLWARTVTCKACRATIPLLKTRWLCKTEHKRVVLGMEPHSPSPSPLSGEGERDSAGVRSLFQGERVVLGMDPHPPAPSPLRGEGERDSAGVRSPLRGEGPGVRVPAYVYDLARELRSRQTATEETLWIALRDRRFGGYKFRRQHPLGRYIADFYCADASLVIEIDGGVHDAEDQQAYDRIRDTELAARGLRILHLTSGLVERDPEQALTRIATALRPPLHRSGEGPGVRFPDRPGVRFSIQTNVPTGKGSAAQRIAHDKRVGGGTMSKSGATCPTCGAIMTTEDIRLEGRAGRLGAVMTAVVVDGEKGKEYRLPTVQEIEAAESARDALDTVFADVPFGPPNEPTPTQSQFSGVANYGMMKWSQLFTPRQLVALGTFVKHTRAAREAVVRADYPTEWVEALEAYLALAVDRVGSRASTLCKWNMALQEVDQTFARFALPILWDFAESNPVGDSSGNYADEIGRIALVCDRIMTTAAGDEGPHAIQTSATGLMLNDIDVIVTDPPYYDAIPYSDLMDFFYVWLRRSLHGSSPSNDAAFSAPLAPKWDHDTCDGELIDDASRFGGDKATSKKAYEDGMARAFQTCHHALATDGRLVIVFAHKQPDAWETLVSAIIRAGFVVDGSWPIKTERSGGLRNYKRASLSSSVWLVCRKRAAMARPGWDNVVLDEMRANITTKMRDFWDAGIRGPDFVWAATGPALEAYSKYPVVKKANEPGQVMPVSDFLAHARRIVVEFVVGRVLSQEGEEEAARDLDAITTYYLLHRHDFGMEAAPVGPCILYAVSCGLRDSDLTGRYDLLAKPHPLAPSPQSGEGERGSAGVRFGDAEWDENLAPSPQSGEGERDSAGVRPGAEAEEEETGGGSTVKLKPWHARKHVGLAADGVGQPTPLIDRTHRIMQLWRAGDVAAVDEYLDTHGLRRSALFHHLLQALIELAAAGSEERSLLESISNHVNARAAGPQVRQPALLGEQ